MLNAATYQRELDIKQHVIRALNENKLQKFEQKYQMLKIIQFFGERRPELLLAFTKTFLIVSDQYSSQMVIPQGTLILD